MFDERGTEKDPRKRERRKVGPLSNLPRVTCFVCPVDADGLLHDTRRIILGDDRVIDVVARFTPTDDVRENESLRTRAERAWRRVLPTHDAGDMLQFRQRYGWGEDDINQIVDALILAHDSLLDLASTCLLEGTKTTLARDALGIVPTIRRWLSLWEQAGGSQGTAIAYQNGLNRHYGPEVV